MREERGGIKRMLVTEKVLKINELVPKVKQSGGGREELKERRGVSAKEELTAIFMYVKI